MPYPASSVAQVFECDNMCCLVWCGVQLVVGGLSPSTLLAGDSEGGNPIIICCGLGMGSTKHTRPAIGWHALCLSNEELEVPLQEVLDSPDDHKWACKPCALQLAGMGIYIDWKIVDKTTMTVQVGRKRRIKVAYNVQWLGGEGTTVALHSDMTGTQSMHWYRTMPELDSSGSD